MDPITFVFVVLISFGIMFFGAISGGVGLVLRPILIFLGFPAVAVVASARVSGLVCQVPAILLLHKEKRIDWKIGLFMTIPMFLGSFIASVAVVSILKNSLEVIIGTFLFIIGSILVLKRVMGLQKKKPHFSKKVRSLIGFLGTAILSFFNTITGGMGPVFSSLYVVAYGKTFIDASAIRKIASYIGGGTASLVFIVSGVVDWQLFAALAIGATLGSYFGAKHSLKKGEEWVRLLVILVVFASAIKMIFF